jgi:hypothetical protein
MGRDVVEIREQKSRVYPINQYGARLQSYERLLINTGEGSRRRRYKEHHSIPIVLKRRPIVISLRANSRSNEAFLLRPWRGLLWLFVIP